MGPIKIFPVTFARTIPPQNKTKQNKTTYSSAGVASYKPVFLRVWSADPLGSLRTFQGIHAVKTLYNIEISHACFHCVDNLH